MKKKNFYSNLERGAVIEVINHYGNTNDTLIIVWDDDNKKIIVGFVIEGNDEYVPVGTIKPEELSWFGSQDYNVLKAKFEEKIKKIVFLEKIVFSESGAYGAYFSVKVLTSKLSEFNELSEHNKESVLDSLVADSIELHCYAGTNPQESE